MKTEIMELEKVLNQEIEAYSRLEKYILDKRDSLINNDINKLKDIDCELEKISSVTKELESKRMNITSKIGNENLTLKDIIQKIEDENQAARLNSTTKKLRDLTGNIQKQNNVNKELIKHSLKLIEHSVTLIANTLVPESSVYNKMGKYNNNTASSRISSVIHEA